MSNEEEMEIEVELELDFDCEHEEGEREGAMTKHQSNIIEGFEIENCTPDEADAIEKYILACLSIRDHKYMFGKSQKRIEKLSEVLDILDAEYNRSLKPSNVTDRVYSMLTSWISGAINFA